MDKGNDHIVIFTKDKEDDKLLIHILSEHFNTIHVIASETMLVAELKNVAPKVIFISGLTMADILFTYYKAIENIEETKLCQHGLVALITKNQEQEAYQAFCSGILDDYIIARPLYELHRPILVCEHILKHLGLSTKKASDEACLEMLSAYPEHIQEVIGEGIERKHALKEKFEVCIAKIELSLNLAEKNLHNSRNIYLDLDLLKHTLGAIRSDQYRPGLLKLQTKALDLLDGLVTDADEETAQKRALAENANGAASASAGDATSGAAAESKEGKNADGAEKCNDLHNEKYVDKDIKVPKIPTVLVIEDDTISMNLTLMLLKQFYLKVDSSFSGRMAIDFMMRNKYDIILMDINLPDTNGFYLLTHIQKANCINTDTPVAMLTGNKNANAVRQAKMEGAKGYLLKPLRKDALLKLFQQHNLPLREHK